MQKEAISKWEEYPDYFKQVLIDPKKDQEVDFLMQKIRMKPNSQAKEHYHKNQKEIFIVTKNKGYFIVNNKKIMVGVGDKLKILPNEKHTVGNDNQEEFEFIAIKLKFHPTDTYLN